MNIYREKLLNAVLFFAKNTRNLNLGKIFKLLYFLDFTHFGQTGYPSIGLQYYAFERGPVPRDFWAEIKDGVVPSDFVGKINLTKIVDESNPLYKEVKIKAMTSPDLSIFTPREIDIMKKLAFIFEDAKAWQMSEVSHLSKHPWDVTRKEKGDNSLIDYLLSIDSKSEINTDDAVQSLTEYFEVVNNFGLSPTKLP